MGLQFASTAHLCQQSTFVCFVLLISSYSYSFWWEKEAFICHLEEIQFFLF